MPSVLGHPNTFKLQPILIINCSKSLPVVLCKDFTWQIIQESLAFEPLLAVVQALCQVLREVHTIPEAPAMACSAGDQEALLRDRLGRLLGGAMPQKHLIEAFLHVLQALRAHVAVDFFNSSSTSNVTLSKR